MSESDLIGGAGEGMLRKGTQTEKVGKRGEYTYPSAGEERAGRIT